MTDHIKLSEKQAKRYAKKTGQEDFYKLVKERHGPVGWSRSTDPHDSQLYWG